MSCPCLFSVCAQMVVTGLLANTALTLAKEASPGSEASAQAQQEAESTINRAWQVLAILAFICSMVQLALGAMIGVSTVGRTPRAVMRFFFWGEYMADSSLSCFIIAILCQSMASLLYLYRLTSQSFDNTERTILVSCFGGLGCILCMLAFYFVTIQLEYEMVGRMVHRNALLSLEPLMSYFYEHKSGDMTWSGERWPPLRAYIKLQGDFSRWWFFFERLVFILGPVSLLLGLVWVYWFIDLEKKFRAEAKKREAKKRDATSMAGGGTPSAGRGVPRELLDVTCTLGLEVQISHSTGLEQGITSGAAS